MSKPILAYVGPDEGVSALEEVAASRFDIHRVVPEAPSIAQGLRVASAFLDASMKVRITPSMIEEAPHLRLVVTATTGADHIDQEALARRGIPLWTLREQKQLLQNLTPAAEHSWLLLMACARFLIAAQSHVLAGGWDRAQFPGMMLRGKTIGIIGCGRIGQWMARYADAFGMRCQGYDPYLEQWPSMIDRVELETLLARSDAITLHVHLSSHTRGLLQRKHFELMKPGCLFINTSRGELIDEGALLECLFSGRIAAAGLDVLSTEPAIDQHPLVIYARTHPNLIITPHIGGNSPDALRVVVRFSAQRILDYFGSV